MTAGYRSWWRYGGEELANSARVGALALVEPPVDDSIFDAPACTCSAGLVAYADYWPGLEGFLGDDPYTDISNAPWYDPARCESSRFHGIWPLVVEGLGPVRIQRELVESFCDGGHATRHRDTTRTVRVDAFLVACDHTAAVYGLQWLTCELRQAAYTRGADLEYLAASPQDSCVDPATLMRTIPDAVLLQEPRIIDEQGGTFGRKFRHGSLWRVEWVWGSGNPYAYGPAQSFPVTWGTDDADPIVWDTTCVDGGGCPEPVTMVTSPLCPPITLPDPAAVSVGCSTDAAGCTPLCEGRVRTFEWTPPATVRGICGDVVVDMWVTNPSATEPVEGVTLSWIPTGGDPECDRAAEIHISYIPPGAAIVLDSVRGRPLVLQGGQYLSAVGLVRTQTGPWSGLTLGVVSTWTLRYEGQDDIDLTLWARPRDV